MHDYAYAAVCLCLQAIDVFESFNPNTMWTAMMQKQSPIHTDLFDETGHLLLANLNALNEWDLQGTQSTELDGHRRLCTMVTGS